jgi:hypothetical protein
VVSRCVIGDEWKVGAIEGGDSDWRRGPSAQRFSHVLSRRRVAGITARIEFSGTPGSGPTVSVGDAAEWEPQYRFALGDDLPYDAAEFQTGFEFVLTEPTSWFTQKRVCTMAIANGYKTL